MIEQAFESLRSRSLLDWGVVLLGVRGGLCGTSGKLDGDLVQSYATSQLESSASGEPAFDAIATLAHDANIPSEERQQLVEIICQANGVDTTLAMRKWRAALIEDALKDIDSNPLYGQIQLSEIWSNWAWPSDGPPSMRRGTKAPSTGDFGSAAAFSKAKQEVDDWLAHEFLVLK